jgi:hypothetical protein
MFPDDEENIAQAALSSFEVVKSQAGRYPVSLLSIELITLILDLRVAGCSHRSGSVHSPSQMSEAKSAHSIASSVSRQSRTSSKNSAGSFDSVGGNQEQDSENNDTEQAMDKIVGWGMKQKIDALKLRRRQDRIRVILTAAARGDIIAMKQAFRVSEFNDALLLQAVVQNNIFLGDHRRNLASIHTMHS